MWWQEGYIPKDRERDFLIWFWEGVTTQIKGECLSCFVAGGGHPQEMGKGHPHVVVGGRHPQ